ncbi:MAG: DUF5663 domain-containing protein [Patescibacteria group bacterium]
MLTELSSKQVVDDFLNKMLTDTGMDNVSPEVREQMFNDLKNRLEDRFLATILANLQEDQITTFREISEANGDSVKMSQFISANLPNANELFAQAMMTFRDVYLGVN